MTLLPQGPHTPGTTPILPPVTDYNQVVQVHCQTENRFCWWVIGWVVGGVSDYPYISYPKHEIFSKKFCNLKHGDSSLI